jgi:hypothetical protein
VSFFFPLTKRETYSSDIFYPHETLFSKKHFHLEKKKWLMKKGTHPTLSSKKSGCMGFNLFLTKPPLNLHGCPQLVLAPMKIFSDAIIILLYYYLLFFKHLNMYCPDLFKFL